MNTCLYILFQRVYLYTCIVQESEIAIIRGKGWKLWKSSAFLCSL